MAYVPKAMVPKEQFHTLVTPEQVEEQIQIRREWINIMVGTLYKSIVLDEIQVLLSHPHRHISMYERLGDNTKDE